MSYTLQPQTEPIWHRLTNDERREVSTWCEIIRRFAATKNKNAVLAELNCQYAPVLGYIVTRQTLYRKMEALEGGVIEAILGAAAVRRAKGIRRSSKLPPVFVLHWRQLVGGMQRRKILPVWVGLMTSLRRGDVMPGYGTDWRGIWTMQHPGEALPSHCPYNLFHQGPLACQPEGWSYSNLMLYAPKKDVLAGAAVGVHAMRKFNMSVPHSRVGLRPMMVITMDDVQPDVYCHYRGESEARRPTGLGVLDIATGKMIGFTLVPSVKRDDGTVSGLQKFWGRYAWANMLCNQEIGIDREAGIVAMLEHGSAGLTDEDVKRINGILGVGPITDAPAAQNPFGDGRGVWLTVQRSSTSGAPIMKGLFAERGRGLPNFKAAIESKWNALHNIVASLPGQAGRNWETAPQDTVGWQRKDHELRVICKALATCPQAVEILKEAQTHALHYDQLETAFEAAINALNFRREHDIQEYEQCGYILHMVEVGGALVPMDRAADDLAGGDAEMREIVMKKLAPKQRVVRMSPAEAWASHPKSGRKVFAPFVATEILGEELSQVVTVGTERTFEAVNHWSKERLTFSANVRTEDQGVVYVEAGEKLRVWVNPMNVNWALVSRADGQFLGLARHLAPAQFGKTNEDALGELQLSRSEQRRRLAEVVGGRAIREVEREMHNIGVINRALDAAGAATTFKGVEAADVMHLTGGEQDETAGEYAGEEPEEESILSRIARTRV